MKMKPTVLINRLASPPAGTWLLAVVEAVCASIDARSFVMWRCSE